jgi:cytochrome P450
VTLPRFNPVDPELIRDPYPAYARYRQSDPVHWGVPTMADLAGSWYLFRYADNRTVLADNLGFASNPATVGVESAVPEAFRPIRHIHQRWLGGIDPPDHARLRAIMAKAFTPRRVTALAPRVQSIAEGLVDEALLRGDGRIDVVGDVAFPLPMQVIGDALGVEPADWKQFQHWAEDISDAVDRAGDPDAGAAGAAAIQGMYDYFAVLVAERRASHTDDLLGAMVAAADDDGQPMQEFDCIAIATELGVAGHETTMNSVGKSVLGLMEQRDRWDELRAYDGAFPDGVVEELLRWTTPVQRQRWRWATAEAEIGGRSVARGDAVVSILAAANRDPEVFADPDRIDFGRPATRHVTFGFGTHFCLGAALARLELRAALQTLSDRIPEMQLVEAPEDVPWNRNSIMPGPKAVLVSG